MLKTETKKAFFVRYCGKMIRIKLDELCAMKADGDYVHIVTLNNSYRVHMTLVEISSNLPKDDFVRIHNSYVVCIDKIDKIEGNTAFINNLWYPISSGMKKNLMERVTVI